MLLIDFDWGGKEGEVYFPRGTFAEEPHAQSDQAELLDRPITKEDDDRALAGMFEPLDEILEAYEWEPGNDQWGHGLRLTLEA